MAKSVSESVSGTVSGKILIGADHAGFELKESLKARFPRIDWIDVGTYDTSRADYPDYADRLSARLGKDADKGILVCGSGQGMAIRANRHPHVRAALAFSEENTQLARQHNDANVLCLGSRLIDRELNERLVEIFLNTSFEGGRHQDRLDKIKRPTSGGC